MFIRTCPKTETVGEQEGGDMRLDLHGTWRWNQIKPSVLAIGRNGSPEVPKTWDIMHQHAPKM